ncbi:saccharopine dehydrogenase NADP-binding domain-containing protein, partial [Hydrogenimonas sp.]
MKSVLIIGAGGVGRVVAHKCAQNAQTFGPITLASRTLEKCETIRDEVKEKTGVEIAVEQVDADKVEELVALIEKCRPYVVINVALPYQDLTIMEACLKTGVHYLDTANYEHPDTAKFEYKEQWAKDGDFKAKGLMALLGSGFDP